MQACTKVIAAISGTGTQTITGVVDADGTAFVGTMFFVHGNAAANSITTPMRVSMGVDDGSGFACGLGVEANNTAGIKLICGGGGSDSVIDEQSQLAFGGFVARYAYVSRVAAGEFDITYTRNTRTGDSFAITVLGGTDLDVATGYGTGGSTTQTIGFAAEAVVLQHTLSGAIATSPSGSVSCGWATKASGQGSASAVWVDEGGNGRYQVTDKAYVSVGNGLTVFDSRTITTWGDTAFTFSGSTGGSFAWTALGGIRAAAGSLVQPDSIGVQTITVDFAVRAFFVVSVGAPANPSVDTTVGAWSHGMTDGTRQVGYWTAESLTGATGGLTGAKMLSTSDLLLFATPNANSTTISARAALSAFSDAGLVALNWTQVDGVARQVLWLALGDPVPPAPPTSRYPIRRVRRFMLPFDQNYNLFISRLEILAQTGVGLTTGQGSDPVLMFRMSWDGGATWGNERQMSIGKIGQYLRRCYTMRLGSGRQPVAEIACSDPVFLSLLDCYVDAEKGLS